MMGNRGMKKKKNYINHEIYEGEEIISLKDQSLDHLIYDYYKNISTEAITKQGWTAHSDIFTLILELNSDFKSDRIQSGESLFMPNVIVNTADGRLKLWE